MNNESQNSASEKKSLYLEYGLFIVLGFLLGIVIKTEASKNITTGYNDYKIKTDGIYYDLNALQKDVNKKNFQNSEN